jgi:hypothetical protein
MFRIRIAIAFTGAAALSVLTLDGCVSAVDREYGKAVHQMVTVQVYHPETLWQKSDSSVEGVDPDSAKAAVDAMRKDTSERTHTQQPVIFTYGTSGGSSQ